MPSLDVRDHCRSDDVRQLAAGGAGGGLEQAFAQLLRDSAAQLEDCLAKLLFLRPVKRWIPQDVRGDLPVPLVGRKLLEDPASHDSLDDDVVPPVRQHLVPDDRRGTAERPKAWPICVLRFPPRFDLSQRQHPIGLQRIPHHLPVALFENMERQNHSREQHHRRQRENLEGAGSPFNSFKGSHSKAAYFPLGFPGMVTRCQIRLRLPLCRRRSSRPGTGTSTNGWKRCLPADTPSPRYSSSR